MCGIAAWFSKTETPTWSDIHKLASQCELRGKDGFGFCHISRSTRTISIFRSAQPFSEILKDPFKSNIWTDFNTSLTKNHFSDLYIMIGRAAPETEYSTDVNALEETLQPICIAPNPKNEKKQWMYENDGITITKIHLEEDDNGIVDALVCVHNGSVANKIINELKNDYAVDYSTKIDSEAIIRAYQTFNRDIKHTFEYLTGGYSVIFYDFNKDCLYLVNDFKPLAIGRNLSGSVYISSTLESLKASVGNNGVDCKWLMGGKIREFYNLNYDKFQEIEYSPRYVTPFWDSNSLILNEYDNYER